MYVDVSLCDGADNADWRRLKSVVDTGSTHTLIGMKHVIECGLVSSIRSGVDALVAVDGTSLNVNGSLSL